MKGRVKATKSKPTRANTEKVETGSANVFADLHGTQRYENHRTIHSGNQLTKEVVFQGFLHLVTSAPSSTSHFPFIPATILPQHNLPTDLPQ